MIVGTTADPAVVTDHVTGTFPEELIEHGLSDLEWNRHPDGMWFVSSRTCPGAWAYARNREEALEELRSVIEGWYLVDFEIPPEVS